MFNEKVHIDKMQAPVEKLVAYLGTKGISTTLVHEGNLKNVVFTTDKKSASMSFHSFFRFSGPCILYKPKEKPDGKADGFEIIKITDEMYMNNFIKPIIELLLK